MPRTKKVKAEEVKQVEDINVEVSEAEVTTPVEEAPKKTRAKRTTKKTEIVLQFQGKETVITNLEETVKAKFVEEGHKASEMKTVTIYVKPEEAAAYYVINEDCKGRIELF